MFLLDRDGLTAHIAEEGKKQEAPSWPARSYSLADQEGVLLVDEVVQPRRPGGFPPRPARLYRRPGGIPPGRRETETEVCQDTDPCTVTNATSRLLKQVFDHIEAQEGIQVDPNQAQDTVHTSLMEV
ncbi:hypothetical protein PGT21_024295 [Puccinia graminis f. sp. tritici]|uniref:Uncharacterized protein n=1 Tax=Puccinia graminis f. sp. tritici TaxID=56615 RepID=A0A5B0QX29_PUCGR|nr:hypothetical protein PGT21_024295 [Puccinia graminis f. sp. tritici]